MTIPLKYEDVVANLDAALGREASLQKRLNDVVEEFIRYESSFEQVQKMIKNMEMIANKKLEALQQRLTVADQRADELEGLLREWRHGRGMTLLDCARLRNRADAELKPSAEGEGS